MNSNRLAKEHKQTLEITKDNIAELVTEIVQYVTETSQLIYIEDELEPEMSSEEKAELQLDEKAQQERAEFLSRIKIITTSITQQPEFFTNSHRVRIMKKIMDPLVKYNSSLEAFIAGFVEMPLETAQLVEFNHDKLIAKITALVGPEFMTLLRTLEDETPLPTIVLTAKQKSQKREALAKTKIQHAFADRVPEFISGKPAKEKFNIDAKDENGQTQLIIAAKSGAEKLIQNYLQHHADPTVADRNKQTPLFWAAMRGHKEATEILLAASKLNRASKDDRMSEEDRRCIDYITMYNFDYLHDVFLLFLARIKDVRTLNAMLHCAAQEGCEFNFLLLLQHGAGLTGQYKELKLSEIVENSIAIASALLMRNLPIDNPRQFAKVILDFQMKPSYLRFFNGVPFEDRVTPNLPHLYVCLESLEKYHCDAPATTDTEDDTLLTEKQIVEIRNFLRIVSQQNKAICDEIRTTTKLPEDILLVIDCYNHPHGHGSLVYNKKA